MNRLFVCFLAFVCAWMSMWADAAYTGTLKLAGMLGEDINFELFADYYGDGPVLVTGETVYHRKNGKMASIKVYGTWDIETSGQVHLFEFNESKVCGNFYFKLEDEPKSMEWDDTKNIEGYWQLGESILPFVNVTATSAPNALPEYCKFLDKDKTGYNKYCEWDLEKNNGSFGYFYDSKVKGKVNRRFLNMAPTPDSTSYTFYQNVDGEDCYLPFRSRKGFGHKKDMHENGWAFSIGNADYDIVLMKDALMVYRTNPEAVPDNTLPRGVKIEGVYPKLTENYAYFAERLIRKDDPESVTYCDISISVPYLTEGLLADSVKAWVCNHLDERGSEKKDYAEIVKGYAVGRIGEEGDVDEAELYSENWMIPNFHCNITCFVENPKYINMEMSGNDYMGGAHGFPYCFEETIVRRNGKVMKYSDWFTDMEKVRQIVSKAMIEQNDEVEFDGGDDLELPSNDPWLTGNVFVFMYQPYEAAPYCYGMPSCEVEVSKLLPYMTAEAKQLAR